MTAPPWLEAAWAARPSPDYGADLIDLDAAPVIWVTGAPGRGRTTAAACIAHRMDRPILGARLAGCVDADDALLALGMAIDATVAGSRRSVLARLSALQGSVIVIDDTPSSAGIIALLQSLSDPSPGPRWVIVCPTGRAPEGAAAVVLEGPDLVHGALADWGLEAWRHPADLPTAARLMGWLPAGVIRFATLPEPMLVPLSDQRQALRSSVIARLDVGSRAAANRAARTLMDLYEPFLVLSLDGPVPQGATWRDAAALRWMGDVLAEPFEACRCTAAAARLRCAWGQPGAARRLIQAAMQRLPDAGQTARAILTWAEADILSALGDQYGCELRLSHASRLLREARRLRLLARLTRRRGDRLADQGRAGAAAQAYREARALYRQLDDPHGVGATMRGAGDVAVSRGEILSAEALYDQSDLVAAGPREQSNRLIGKAGLSISRGELGRASALLDAIPTEVTTPLLLANQLRRRADLALRRGRHVAARRFCDDALGLYHLAGEPRAAGRTARLRGDVEAASGDRAAARRWYARAVAELAALQDLPSLKRTLVHLHTLLLEEGDEGAARVEAAASSLADLA